MSVFQTMILFQNDHRVFTYINHGQEESKSLEGQKQSSMTVNISTKFRKVFQENRVGVLKDVLLRVDNISR